MLVNREVILFKLESAYNINAVPTAADNAILAENLAWSNEGVRAIERNGVKQTLGKNQTVFGGALKTVTFDVELKGSGVAGDAPEIGPCLRACGLGETIVASTSVSYSPVSEGMESATIYYYSDGILHVITGARGNVSFNLEGGSSGKASFTFTGHAVDPSDTPLVTPTYDSTVPPPIINVGFSIGGYNASIAALALDLANAVSMPTDMTSPDGFGEIIITSRDVAGSYDPEQVLLAQKNYIDNWQNDVTELLQTGVIGSVPGNRFSLSVLAAYARDIAQGDREGLRTYDISFGAAEVSGDDEFTLTFT